MNYGYARCSANESRQDISRQRRVLCDKGVSESNIFFEYESGTKKDRVELNRLLETVQPGDSIITTEVSRLTRSTSQLCELIETIKDKKLQLVIGSIIVDCRGDEPDPMTKGMLMLWGVFSEMEREMISQRVKSGVLNAKAKGKILGRPPTTIADIPHKFWEQYDNYASGNINITDYAKLCGCSRNTIYKYLRLVEANK